MLRRFAISRADARALASTKSGIASDVWRDFEMRVTRSQRRREDAR
jgi:hypothetical protein